MPTRKSRDDEIYEQGVHDGQVSDFLDQVSHSLAKGFHLNPREAEIYNKGYEYGVAHRPQKPNDRPVVSARSEESRREVEHAVLPSSSNDTGCALAIGVIVVVVAVIAVALWLLVNIILPIGLLNSAAICTILAFKLKTRRAIFASAALVGGCYMLADIANGWLSANFLTHVVHDASWLTAFVYINSAAVGASTWILARPLFTVASRMTIAEDRKAFFLSGGATALVLIATITPPIVYHIAPHAFLISGLQRNLPTMIPNADLTTAIPIAGKHTFAQDDVPQTPRAMPIPAQGSATRAVANRPGAEPSTQSAAPQFATEAAADAIGNWSSVSVGLGTVCAVTTTNAAYCWGRGFQHDSSRKPVAVMVGHQVAMVSVGHGFVCWLTTSGAAFCAGGNDEGQLGNGKEFTERISGNRDSVTPTPVAGGYAFSIIAAGGSHACALTKEGSAYCWGDNKARQLGNGSQAQDYNIPVGVAGGLRFATLSAGSNHTCAVTTEGAAYCWGTGYYGDGALGGSSVPRAVGGELRFVSMTASVTGNFTCGVTTRGGAYCWGEGYRGELGNGKAENSLVPVAIQGLAFKTLSAGDVHACGITTDAAAYCWGEGGWGNLGAGKLGNELSPVPVAGSLKFASISSGGVNSCGVSLSGQLYCWGSNQDGELGGSAREGYTRVPLAVTEQP